MEPKTQVEIQLGHMCNNRCVFCVSGQETALGRAGPLEADPVIESIRAARAAGHAKLTLLGGEPTLQPGFMAVLREAVALGFEEIVIFTNGVKTARGEFIDEILATGGNFTWRISLQGATRAAHDATTKKPGAFDRIVRTLEGLHARGERVTVNMCVVESNYESVHHFPELLVPHGVVQLHLDMMRPLDAGQRTEEELRAAIPHYPSMVPALEAMAAGFPEGFDLNIGNLPFCLAPGLARYIHHDGEHTLTISVDNGKKLSAPWNKYLTKKRDKIKPPSCKGCVFDGRCSGVYDTYARFHGTEALVPVTPAMLRKADPSLRLLSLHIRPALEPLLTWAPPAPFERVVIHEAGDREMTVSLEGPGARLKVSLREPGAGAASFDLYSLHVLDRPDDATAATAGLEALWAKLCEGGASVLHPLGDDALVGLARTVALRVERLRGAAPFGQLAFRSLRVSEGGARAEAELTGPSGERAFLWLTERAGRPAGGYRLDDGTSPTPALVAGLRAAIASLGLEPRHAAAE
jgi:MoaA/NifB/PqqE/SkfB family radical SAM enzyme